MPRRRAPARGRLSALSAVARPQEVDGEYVFNDGLKYVKGSWDYATSKDRRFYTETLDTIKPAGELQYTDRVPAPELPKDCYDVGNGYFDPKNGSIHDYATKKKVRAASRLVSLSRGGGAERGLVARASSLQIRDASEKELQWASKKCRVSDIGGSKQ